MSLQFGKNEKVIREFEYASAGVKRKTGRPEVYKSLIVTNKRVIHQEVNETRGNEMVIRREMPIEDAKYVDSAVARISKPARLVWGIIWMLLGAGCIALPFLMPLESTELSLFNFKLTLNLNMILLCAGAFLALIGLICIIGYFSSRQAILRFTVSTGHPIYSVFGVQAVENNKNSDKKNKKAEQKAQLEIQIKRSIAFEMADALGAALIEARDCDIHEPQVIEKVVVTEKPVVVEKVVVTEKPVVVVKTVPVEGMIEETHGEPPVVEIVESFEEIHGAIAEETAEETVEETYEASSEGTTEETEETEKNEKITE